MTDFLKAFFASFVLFTVLLYLLAARTEIIDLSSCKNLQEALKTFEGRKLTVQEMKTKAKIEWWLIASGCEHRA